MPSFSAIFTTLLAISGSALAFTTPTTFNITSNPVFTPNTGTIIPVGKPFKITWGPTESGTVSIILLRGPSSNILPVYPIVEKIKNTGSFTWTPKADLEDDKTHYGIQIIIDANGQYQFSTQFGISNPDYEPATTTSARASSSSSTADYEPTTTSYETVSLTTKSYLTSMITLTSAPPQYNTTTTYAPTYTSPAPSYSNSTIVSSVPTAVPTASATSPPSPSQTGAAANLKVASGLLVGVAAAAALLF
jgi:hypothetical protein